MNKLFVLFLIFGCNTPMPKPNGMLAMDYPPPKYQQVSTECPYTFDFNSVSSIEVQSNCFFSISYPSMKAKVYMSYFNLKEHQIENLYRDFNTRLMDHTKKEVQIQESNYENISQQKFGRFYEITSDSPSNLHFHLTDQKKHFISGVLFFSATPNYDSLYPAIQYIKNDLRHLTESLSWR